MHEATVSEFDLDILSLAVRFESSQNCVFTVASLQQVLHYLHVYFLHLECNKHIVIDAESFLSCLRWMKSIRGMANTRLQHFRRGSGAKYATEFVCHA